MDHMIGKGWRDLFDVIITQARKPSFYHQQASRFVSQYVLTDQMLSLPSSGAIYFMFIIMIWFMLNFSGSFL